MPLVLLSLLSRPVFADVDVDTLVTAGCVELLLLFLDGGATDGPLLAEPLVE